VVHRFGVGTSGAQLAVVLDVDWKVWTNSVAYGLDEGSSSDRNDLQGDGHASTEEHIVGDCWRFGT